MSEDVGLCFYKLDGIPWPAFKYSDGNHLMEDAKDEIDNPLKARIAIDMISSFMNNEEKHVYVQPMGKPVSEYIKLKEGEDEYYCVYQGMARVLGNETLNPKAFRDDNEYLAYMAAMAELCQALERLSKNLPIRGQTDPETYDKWKKRGEMQLRLAASRGDQRVARDSTEAVETGISTPEKSRGSFKATEDEVNNTSTAASVMQSDDVSTPKASYNVTTNSPARQGAREIDLHSKTSSPGHTPKANNTRTHSDNATVVSVNDSSLAEESDVQPIPFRDPQIKESDSINTVYKKLILNSGWGRQEVNGEVLFWMPHVTLATGIRQKTIFTCFELEDYLKEVNLWKYSTARKLIFTPIQKAKKAKRANSLNVTPSRSSSRRSSRARGSEQKKREFAEDDFYFFPNLINFLQAKLGWDYKPGGVIASWAYIPGTSKLGLKGEYGVDFFTEEEEVVLYCMKNKFKENYGHLLDSVDTKRARIGTVSP